MSAAVHPTAVVADGVTLGDGVAVGPYAVIETDVTIGAGTTVATHAVIGEGTRIGERCRVFPGACVGLIPQDLKFAGEKTYLRIGNDTTIRECVTVSRGTKARGETVIGSECLLMAYAHVGHDCVVGDHVILANGVAVAGHVEIGSHVTVGGLVPVHQFTRIGDHAFVGAAARPFMDIVPFALVGAEPTRISGVNKVGLERRGFSAERRTAIGSAYRTLFRKGLTLADATRAIEAEFAGNDDVRLLVSFVKLSTRGLLRPSGMDLE